MYLSIALLALPLLTAAFPFPLSYLSSRSSVLARRNLTSDTQNDLVNGLACKEITVIFARGTVSPGNMGTSVGPPLVEAIGALVGVDNIAVQGMFARFVRPRIEVKGGMAQSGKAVTWAYGN